MRNIGWGRYILDGGVLHIVVHATLVADAAVVATTNPTLFLNFSYACPEPVLVK